MQNCVYIDIFHSAQRPVTPGFCGKINVQLFAKEFNMERELFVHVKPEIVVETSEVAEHDITKKSRTEEGPIEEFTEPAE